MSMHILFIIEPVTYGLQVICIHLLYLYVENIHYDVCIAASTLQRCILSLLEMQRKQL